MQLPNGFTLVQIARCVSPRRLDLTILPTEECSFRCTYCYEDFAHGAMPPHVVEGVCSLISRRAEQGLEEIHLSWFGGEPLTAPKVVRTIARHAADVADRYGIALEGGFTTNGYHLKTKLLSEMVSLRQTFFQISLDGWGAIHDETRRRADGRGTFDVIWANLKAARDTNLKFRIVLRIHVTDCNHESLRTLCAEVGKEFGGDDRFSVNFQDVRDMGGNGAATVVPVDPRVFRSLKGELDLIIRAHDPLSASKSAFGPQPGPKSTVTETSEIPFRLIVPEDAVPKGRQYESAGSRADFKSDENYICYASKPNHLLIRANGRVGKCTVALSDPRNELGYLCPDGTVKLNEKLAKRWSHGIETMDPDALGCPIAFWHMSASAESSVSPETAADI